MAGKKILLPCNSFKAGLDSKRKLQRCYKEKEQKKDQKNLQHQNKLERKAKNKEKCVIK